MCGIAGIVGAERDFRVEPAVIRRMCQKIVHRGPDDEGAYVKGRVGLGMRRLSIIDLSTGQQPIRNEDGTVWVVFNGEIYNFPELRPELEKRGHRFYTNSDTEVIVHLYEEFGADCVQKLRGMFAFALYDERRERLLLARDRLGKKPLHYALSRGRLLFASEIKALLAAAPELSEIDEEGLLHFFYFGYILDPLTAFVKIRKLPPGYLLEFEGGRVRTRQYWEVPRYGTAQPRSEEECLGELEHCLGEAVRLRLIADVPLGALLSGGVDSSTVVALMARSSSRPVKTFTIGFRQEDFNEAKYARQVAERFGAEHHELVVEPNFTETLESLTRMMEEPFGDSSMVPTYIVCALARQHVTVALAGDGGDELFAGYDRYGIHLGRQRFTFLPAWAGRFYRRWVYPRLPEALPGRRFVFNLSLDSHERYLDSIASLPAEARERSIFSPDFLARATAQGSPLEPFRSYLRQAPASDVLSQLLYLDTKTYLPGDILTKVDRMSMATSLEVRAPLLDHLFVERAVRIPASWKHRHGQGKYILKKLAERVGVPADVLNRPKQGFAIPLVHWFRKELKQGLVEILLEPRSLGRGYFDPRAVRQMIEEHQGGRRDRSAQLWLLLVFELWHRNFLEARSKETFGTPRPVGAVREASVPTGS